MDFIELSKKFEKEIIDERRYLHRNAEVGFELPKTVEFVEKKLTEMGYCVKRCGKNGIVTTIGKGAGKTFLLRADMDALPIKEESNIEFACENGCFHGCGHDMHTAMLLGAARILKEVEAELDGTVKLMFQPAEEILSGAKNMLENGLFDSHKPDGAMMLHVMAGLPMKTGSVIVASGGVSAPAADYFTVNIKGRGCHGSMPQDGVDALSVASHTVVALQEISARELGVSEAALLTIGSLRAGTAGNVIADTAVFEGTLRSFSDEVRLRLKKRLEEISVGIASTFRAKAEVVFGNGCPSLVNDEKLSASIKKYMIDLLGGNSVFSSDDFGEDSSKKGGSEDFSYISREVPSVMLAIAAGNSEEGYAYAQHHPKVMFDESVLTVGSAVYAYSAFRWLQDNK